MERNYFVVGLIMLTFFVISFLTNIIGPLVPEIIEDFDLSLTLVALLPFAFFIAYGVTSIPAGMLVERYSAKRVTVAAFALAFCGALLLAMYPYYLMAIVSLFLIGTGMAMLQVALHPVLRVAGGEEHFAFNSVLGQLFFGLASFLSPLVYSYLVLNLAQGGDQNFLLDLLAAVVPPDLPWISLYWIFAAVCLVMIGVLTVSPIPSIDLADDEQVGPMATHFDLLKRPLVILYFIGIFCYVGTEQGVANWMSEFLSSYHGFDPRTEGAAAVSLFWGLMTAGTLLGLLALKLMDSRHVLIIFSAAAIISFSTGLFGPADVARYALPAVGFFISVMWSVIFSLALNSVTEHHGSFSGIL
ncbi:MAG: MFS transporter, partial [Rhodothermales bacterium]